MIWKTIPSYPNYEASEDGQVRSKDRIVKTSSGQYRLYKSRIISPSSANQYGHQKGMVAGKPRYFHRLVAEAFLGTCPDDCVVAHCDGNPKNNSASNLRYATPVENNSDKNLHGTLLRGENHPGAKLSADQVSYARRAISMGFTQSDIASALNVSRATISAIATGRSWA